MNNNKYHTIFIGRNYYPIEIEVKPCYWDSSGQLCIKTILVDLAEQYKGLSDDAIIHKLKELKDRYLEDEKKSKWQYEKMEELDQDDMWDRDDSALQKYDQAVDVYMTTYEGMMQNKVDRQILTNAFALKNGASAEDICQLTVPQIFFHDLQLVNDDEKASDILLEYLYEDHAVKYDLIIDVLRRFFQFLYSGQIIEYTNYTPKLSQIVEKLGLQVSIPNEYRGIDELGDCFNEFAPLYLEARWPSKQVASSDFLRSLLRKIDEMKSKLQFPPYGEALVLDYEDEGQRILPWSGNLSDKDVMKYRKVMHDYTGNDKSKVFQAILGAYCNGYFNDVPSYKQARLEFSPITFSASTYSDYVTKRILGTTEKEGICRFLEYGYSRYGNLEEDIKDEKFFLIFKELKDA